MFKRKVLIVLTSLVLCTCVSASLLGRIIDQKMSSYVTEEVDKVSKILIRKILNDDFFDKFDLKKLFHISKKNDGEIEMIDFDTVEVNRVLGNINDEIIYYFNEFDNGNISLIEKYSNVFNNYVSGDQRGVFINIPIGIIFSNSMVFGVGPSIPIKILLSGQVKSDIKTSIKQYGINNVLLEIDVVIEVKEKIIFPFSSKYVNVSLEMPLVLELISGKVPENYLNTQNSDIIK